MAAKHSVHVALTEPLAGYVTAYVASGEYATASEALRTGLRMLIERDEARVQGVSGPVPALATLHGPNVPKRAMTAPASHCSRPAWIRSGVQWHDKVLIGGLTPIRLYLVEGAPGSVKTTVPLRFLLEGSNRGEVASMSCSQRLSTNCAQLLVAWLRPGRHRALRTRGRRGRAQPEHDTRAGAAAGQGQPGCRNAAASAPGS